MIVFWWPFCRKASEGGKGSSLKEIENERKFVRHGELRTSRVFKGACLPCVKGFFLTWPGRSYKMEGATDPLIICE